MPKAKALITTNGAAGAGIEYLKRRRVVRLFAWSEEAGDIEPIEVPIGSLCEQLGIDLGDLRPPSQYLLFGGSGRRSPGSRLDLVRGYACEMEARAAFRQIRVDDPSPGVWAELVALDAAGKVKPVCWYGSRPRADTEGRPAAAM